LILHQKLKDLSLDFRNNHHGSDFCLLQVVLDIAHNLSHVGWSFSDHELQFQPISPY